MIIQSINNICDINSNLTNNKEVTVLLLGFNWDDFGYKTSFNVYLRNKNNEFENIGVIKIGIKNIDTGFGLIDNIERKKYINFIEDNLENYYFSLGQNEEYYIRIIKILGEKESQIYFKMVNDVAFNFHNYKSIPFRQDLCFRNSLMRFIQPQQIEQFNRISNGGRKLKNYAFGIYIKGNQGNGMVIDVNPDSLLPSNIHVVIGSNGVGKTHLLYNILNILTEKNLRYDDIDISNYVFDSDKYSKSNEILIDDYNGTNALDAINGIVSVIGVSFSVFDDALFRGLNRSELKEKSNFNIEEINDIFEKNYKYIGAIKEQKHIKNINDFSKDFKDALDVIRIDNSKIKLYENVIKHLNNDEMFYRNEFLNNLKGYLDKNNIAKELILEQFEKLSSGHMVIILTLTILTSTIAEKTIVLIDEPENHLHPPLLSAYIKALSYLLSEKNAVAIIATHSPVVLQEVPKKCVKKIISIDGEMIFESLDVETFAEGVDKLTREVFGLEIIKTGFYKFINNEVDNNPDKDFEQLLNTFEGQIGSLGKILIQNRIFRDRGSYSD